MITMFILLVPKEFKLIINFAIFNKIILYLLACLGVSSRNW